MDERERLVDLLNISPFSNKTFGEVFYKSVIKRIAEHLIKKGVIVPPVQIGDREAAYLVGYMFKEKDDRFITFKKMEKYPDLKDTFGLPDKINVKDLKKIWTKAVEDLGGDFTTNEKTIDKTAPVEDFETIKAKGIELGGLLASNGHLAEATAVLQRNIGLDDDGNVKMFDTLRDTQLDLTKIIVMELEELVEKFKIKG